MVTWQAGAYSYDGWANVHGGLIKRSLPWRPLLVEHRNKKAAGSGITFSLAEPAGVAAARRLHQEAERNGFCTCGLVRPSRFAQPPPSPPLHHHHPLPSPPPPPRDPSRFAQQPMRDNEQNGKRERETSFGLTEDRSSTVRMLMSDDCWRDWVRPRGSNTRSSHTAHR